MDTTHVYEKLFGGTTTEIFFPAPLLRRYIISYNFFSGPHFVSSVFYNPIPNGLLEMYIHFGDSSLMIADGFEVEQYKNFIVGLFELDKKSKVRPVASDVYKGICLRFTYEGIDRLMGIKISESVNSIICLEDIYGNKGKELSERLQDAKDNQQKAGILDGFFLEILSWRYKKNARLSIIYEYLQKKTGRISVDDMADTAGLSYRTIHRRFKEELGVGPKDYLQIIRFNNVCQLLVQYPTLDLQDIIYFSGYYDQSHFIHEFKSIMKVSPLEFLKKSKGKFYLTRPFYLDDEDIKLFLENYSKAYNTVLVDA
jgi:AraC-like DNA-binding protein